MCHVAPAGWLWSRPSGQKIYFAIRVTGFTGLVKNICGLAWWHHHLIFMSMVPLELWDSFHITWELNGAPYVQTSFHLVMLQPVEGVSFIQVGKHSPNSMLSFPSQLSSTFLSPWFFLEGRGHHWPLSYWPSLDLFTFLSLEAQLSLPLHLEVMFTPAKQQICISLILCCYDRHHDQKLFGKERAYFI